MRFSSLLNTHDIVVMGASAGGVEVLREVVSGLPMDFAGSVFVVLHTAPDTPGYLPRILSRNSYLSVKHAKDGEAIEPKHIYVAPPDYHMLVRNGHINVVRGPKENRHRPAIDPLFRSAAAVYGPRVMAVLLTGALDDGTAGLQAVKSRGGITIVQDPDDAAYPQMPANALRNVAVDYIEPAEKIGPLVAELAGTPVLVTVTHPPADMEKEAKIAEIDMEVIENFNKPGTASGFVCPECDGTLWEIQDGELVRYRCRVGHSYGPESILAAKNEALETALWMALRALEEAVELNRRAAARANKRKMKAIAQRFEERAQTNAEHARSIRQILLEKPALEVPAQLTGTA